MLCIASIAVVLYLCQSKPVVMGMLRVTGRAAKYKALLLRELQDKWRLYPCRIQKTRLHYIENKIRNGDCTHMKDGNVGQLRCGSSF